MARTTRPRLSEVRVRTATAGDAKHGRQLFDRLGSNGLYLHVTPGVAKCWVQQLTVPNAATGKSRRVRIGLGAWPRVTLAQARKAAFANRCLRDEGRDPLAAKRHRAHEATKEACVPTFARAIEEVIAIRRPTWKDAVVCDHASELLRLHTGLPASRKTRPADFAVLVMQRRSVDDTRRPQVALCRPAPKAPRIPSCVNVPHGRDRRLGPGWFSCP